MAAIQTGEGVLDLLAAAVEYPTPDLPSQAWDCAVTLQAIHWRAARRMVRFARFVAQTPLPTLEERYAATFDLRPVCYPYIGFHLFGETYKRGEFLARLNERYRERGFDVVGELPDHLGVVLRYLARTPDPALLEEGAIPALQRMIPPLREDPYRDPLQAILAVLRAQARGGAV